MLQFHYKAADPPGDCRSDLWFTHQLAKRLKKLYEPARPRATRASRTCSGTSTPSRASANGDTAGRAGQLQDHEGGQRLPDRRSRPSTSPGSASSRTTARPRAPRGSTAGSIPAPDKNLRRAAGEPIRPASPAPSSTWGWAWPANRRIIYNRASADAKGQPWSERKKWVWWDGEKWTGYDVPDFAAQEGARRQGQAGRPRPGRRCRAPTPSS